MYPYRIRQVCSRAMPALLLISLLLPTGDTHAVAESDSPRLVALAPNLAELVFAAGAGEQLVGVVSHSDFPAAVLELPRVGDAFRVDYETLRRLQPDVVMTWESGTPQSTVDKLISLGFRVVAFEARRLDEIPLELERIGELAGTRKDAAAAAAELREGIAALRERYMDRDRLSVFYQISANPWFTVSGEHVISEVLTICGGDNVFAATPGVAPAVSFESVLRRNPQVIIAGTKNSEWRQPWQPWDSVQAVASGAMYSVNPDFVNRATPRLLAGAAQICAVLEEARGQSGHTLASDH
ncbi:MAG: cobalamin-binding protein [Gammaproteobacteria bacterium]|nr:cobalamin-binding protein [Gammaproteobacteria bacterium]